MPRRAHWITRLPDAIRQLERLERDVLIRRDIEKLFSLSKVRAIQLMHAFGGQEFGNRLQVERRVLLERLRRLRKAPDAKLEVIRQENLYQALQQARISSIKVKVKTETLGMRLQGLPQQVSVQQGEIVVRFSTPLEAVERLFELAQALLNDFDSFKEAVGGSAVNS